MSKSSVFYLSTLVTMTTISPLLFADTAPLLVTVVFLVFLYKFAVPYKRQIIHGIVTALVALVCTIATVIAISTIRTPILLHFGVILTGFVLVATLIAGRYYSSKRGVLGG